MMDIVIPYGNEEEFITMAERLGYTGLCFLYNFDDYQDKKFEKNKKIKIYTGILADSRNINKINKLKNKKVFVAIKSSNKDREIIDRLKVDMIFSFEDAVRRDFIHQRASSLNHVLCRAAKEKNVIIGFSLSSILNAGNKSVVLGRMSQNIKLCRKFKVKTVIASFAQKPFDMRSSHDMISLFKSLGSENPTFLK